MFQHYAAFKHMTVRDNVAFGMRDPQASRRTEIRERVDELLGVVGLAGYHERYPNQLSGGQRQRMALARALAVEPSVLLLDEPFGALDAKVRAELREWLRRLHDEVHVTTVLVTHDQEEAMAIADHIAVMDNGRIEQVGGPRELYDQPGERLRDGLPRAGQPDRRRARAPARHRDPASRAARQRRAGRGRRASCTSASRSASSSRSRAASTVSAQVTRHEAERLELGEGRQVWVRTPHALVASAPRRREAEPGEPAEAPPPPSASSSRAARVRAVVRRHPGGDGAGAGAHAARSRSARPTASRSARGPSSRRGSRTPTPGPVGARGVLAPCRRPPGRRRPRSRRRARARACRGRRA